ncbi:MAG: helix-turn-helix domain-containing protein [Ardenticatenales bacterium]|nr:helix-turn-helix domain-containing protein [Ardenticatenales bacterium]
MSVAFNLFVLKQHLQLTLGEEISWSQIAREADLHRNTVERIAHNQTDRIDLVTLAKLVMFFQSKGVEINAGDLFTTDSAKNEAGTA